jgi:hypothetical protein
MKNIKEFQILQLHIFCVFKVLIVSAVTYDSSTTLTSQQLLTTIALLLFLCCELRQAQFITRTQGRIYARAKGARTQGGILKKIEIEVWYAGKKKAVHEREI